MISHLSLVNQKLSFAKALLSTIDSPTSNHKVLNKAQCEAVLLHLYSAYHFYLRELAESNGIKNPGAINSLATLVQLLSAQGKQPFEVSELEELSSNKETWLNKLLTCHSNIYQSPSQVSAHKSTYADNLITLVDVTPEPENIQLDQSSLESWIKEFYSLVIRQRSTGAEY